VLADTQQWIFLQQKSWSRGQSVASFLLGVLLAWSTADCDSLCTSWSSDDAIWICFAVFRKTKVGSPPQTFVGVLQVFVGGCPFLSSRLSPEVIQVWIWNTALGVLPLDVAFRRGTFCDSELGMGVPRGPSESVGHNLGSRVREGFVAGVLSQPPPIILFFRATET